MIKYLFSDIDGTLYVREDIAKEDVHATHRFVEAGGVFSLATGRSDLEVVNFAQQEKFPEPRFRISGNGSMVVDGAEIVLQRSFSQKAKKFLRAYLEKHLDSLANVEISTPDHIYFLMDPEDWVLNYKDNSYTIDAITLNRFEDDSFEIMKMYLEGNEDFIAEMIAAIELEYSDEIEIFSDITAMNLGPRHVTKGTGIQHLLFKYDIKPEEIAVIGDAANDIGMFEVTPNSFTFHYAQDFIKDAANYVVANVAEAIELIIEENEKRKNRV